MNDYLTAIASLELTGNRPRPAWTHRPYPRRRRGVVVERIAALLRTAPQRRPAPALS